MFGSASRLAASAPAGLVAVLLVLAAPAFAQDAGGTPPAPAAPPLASALPPNAPPTFADLAEKQLDAVVFISTTQAPPQGGPQAGPRGPELPGFPPGSPFEEFFREFRDRQRGQPQQQQQAPRPTAALGSGFIIDPAGFVVTNSHVVSEATEISVTMHDGTKLPAKLVGVDGPTDLAVLKVDSRKPLVSAPWGDSEALRVGDWVVAIGNPFGLGGSVTAGILSARQRDIQQGPYDDYLQTDASINRGNSGGPLYNLNGEVIGINTAIYSPTGGSVGIGFAIPSSIARPVIEQLRDHGQVRRGWLGVQVQGVTPDIAESLGMQEPAGALVTSVSPEGPAGKGGVRQGDVITRFNGESIEQMRELPRVVAATKIGAAVPLELLREGKAETLTVTVGELEPQEQVALSGSSGAPRPETTIDTKQVLGLTLSQLTPGLRDSFSINPDVEGVVVTEVGDASAASERGIEAGDVIVEAGQEPVKTPEDLNRLVDDARSQGRKTVLMLLSRDGDLRYVPMPIEDRKG
ncbi:MULTISPECIES: Do family serine endopeptidase [Azospirillum]|uniref:Probable periplasmic serine endoprotease DegP-like n=2 Tax=Azospirillum brasilense TaxID=192 RepID=A0ABU4P8N2_AZOBR|nr:MULTISPECIES: Do family serine endopeptidase [Azospirillum]MDW7629771.1 Do family serine endopeptidase [Azospirillum brasilense]MDX5953930.1 Do family serine endopeptidase [Azospirillum brasilense]PWC88519.1 serine protease [Azospirillum sp. Sp 7]